MAALAAMLLTAGRAAADDPICGDVNDSGTVSASDALLVLQKGVQQPVELNCSAFDTALEDCRLDVSPVVVAVGDAEIGSGGFVTRSTDGGVTWVDAAVQPPDASKLESVASNGSTVVAVDNFAFGDDQVLIYRSLDRGNTWVAATTQPVGSFGLRDIVSNGSRFVAVGVEGSVVFSDDDGDTWAAATTRPTGGNLTGIAARGSRFVAVGGTKAWVSDDNGDTWAEASQHPPGALALTRVAANDTAFVAVGTIESTGAVFTSYDDGVTWNVATTQPVSPGFLIDSIATDGSRFIIGSYFPGRIYYSDDDGDTWTTAATDPVSDIALNAVTFIDHRCVAVDLGGNAHWSVDRGVHWYEAYEQSPGIAGYYGITR